MSDDVKALIESIIDDQAELHIYQDEGYVKNSDVLAEKIVAALEASVQARAVEAECGDYPAPCNCDNPQTHDRIESVQAPAVDREALAREVESATRLMTRVTPELAKMIAKKIVASGILLDAAVVRAQGVIEGRSQVAESREAAVRAVTEGGGNA